MFQNQLFLTFCLFCIFPITKVTAQITPDNTLGVESSIVTPVDKLNDKIQGGAARGSNLFHSFTEFNVGEDRGVDFVNPASIDNIITRVTGNNISNIFGKLGVLGNANLFLINPNGIIFGEGARLDMGGSFYGSTAESVLFPDNVEFSATNPQAPILTINVPIGLGLGNNPGTIINQSVANNSNGLEVKPEANLILVGGEIKFDGGKVTAPGGRVELGGLSAAGIVTLKENGSLSFPQDVARADITLTNAAEVDVRAEGGGSITVNARNLELSAGEIGSSFLRAGIAETSESPGAIAGDIRLNATDTISVSQKSDIVNQVEEEGAGNAGEINVITANLAITEGSAIDASTLGRGDAGDITIFASGDITIKGQSSNGDRSRINSIVGPKAEGNAGEIDITTANLYLTDGGRINASTFGKGDAGTITITASGNILVQGNDLKNNPSGILSEVANEDTAVGNAGNIEITSANLFLKEGGRITTGTFRRGDAGDIRIISQGHILIEGENEKGNPSGIFSNVQKKGVGNAGRISIDTNNLSIKQGGVVTTGTEGQGDAGDIRIISQGHILIEGENEKGNPSGIFSNVQKKGVGNAGRISIDTNNLSIKQGGVVTTGTEGQGNAGNITIVAKEDILVQGEGRNGDRSRIIVSIEGISGTARGNSGGISIKTNNLFLKQGGRVNTSTFARGNAGDINIVANEKILIQGKDQKGRPSGILSEVANEDTAVGNAGNIEISTANLSLTEGGRITTRTFRQGDAGEININTKKLSLSDEAQILVSIAKQGNAGDLSITANSITLSNRSFLLASTPVGEEGNIILKVADIVTLRNNSLISTEATNNANGGNIRIDTDFLVAFPNEDSDITATAFSGSGGQINVNAVGIFGMEARKERTVKSDIIAFSQIDPNLNGQINLNTLEIEPSRQLFLLPNQPLNAQLAQACTPGTKEAKSEFVFTGRGGISPNSLEALQLNPTVPDWLELPSQSAKSPPKLSTPNYSQSTNIVEAQGWIRDENGEVTLVADAANINPHDAWQQPRQCAHN